MTISPFKQLQIGDTVRVTIEGVCTDSDSTGFQMRMDNSPRMGERRYHNFVYNSASLVSAAIIKRRPKVGEYVNRDDLMTWAPTAGTVIVADGSTVSWMKIDRGIHQWVNSTGVIAAPSAMPRGDYRIEIVA